MLAHHVHFQHLSRAHAMLCECWRFRWLQEAIRLLEEIPQLQRLVFIVCGGRGHGEGSRAEERGWMEEELQACFIIQNAENQRVLP